MQKTRFWHWYLEKQSEHEAHMHTLEGCIFHGNTKFQEVGIVKSPLYGKMLILDGDTQSSQLDEFIYHEALVYPALMAHPQPAKVLILGGGEGATLREVLNVNIVKAVTMVDIDGELLELCKTHLPEWSQGTFASPKLNLVIGDARAWVNACEEKFDVIISDLTEPFSSSCSSLLFSLEFFTALKKLLNPEGIFALQASKADLVDYANHAKIINTLDRVFAKVSSYAARVPSFDTMWAFGFASDTVGIMDLSDEELDRRIAARLAADAKFYDSQTRRHIFSRPKYLRDLMAKTPEFLSDESVASDAEMEDINAGLLL